MNPQIGRCMDTIRARLQPLEPPCWPRVAVILGSGLGPFVDSLEPLAEIPYATLPGFPEPGVEGHAGRLLVARLGDTAVALLQGRAHYYEHGRTDAMNIPLRTLAALGCEVLVLTNAAGSLRPEAAPGSVMLITDHINMTGVSPLFGASGDQRFVDMSNAYDASLRQQFLSIAADQGIDLQQGVYSWMSGPQFETPAEIRALRVLGADAVGMSTVPEVILARHEGLKVAALSIITNYAAGIGEKPLSHAQTLTTAAQASTAVERLLHGFLSDYRG